jgi:enamine deaminase RidA (YjgF/YER057c/UK114 family)
VTTLDNSSVVRRDDLLFTGLVTAPSVGGDVRDGSADQLAAAVDRLSGMLTEAGGSLDDVVQVTSFHTNLWSMEDDLRGVASCFGDVPPAWTPVGITGSAVPDMTAGVRAIARLGGTKRAIWLPAHAWATGLPIAAGCLSGELLFISGQTVAHDDGSVPVPSAHVPQARAAYRNIGELLAAASGSFDDILDFTSFHLDMRGAEATFNDVYVPEVIGRVPVDDAATCSHVGTTGLLRPGLVGTYSAIADLSPGRRAGSTPDSVWWKDGYPLAGATRKPGGRLVTVAGHVAAKSDGSIAHPGDALGQLGFVLDGIAETVRGYGMSLDDVAEVCVYTKEHRWAPQLREVFDRRFSSPPALTIVGVPGLWLEGFEIEASALAVRLA